jgi:hypothetical protein
MNHRKASKRWPHVLVAAAISLATVGLTVQVQAASATPAPVCSNGLCTVTFDYSGDVYVYAPPAGIRTMNFELSGAQGGRTGGLGGKVAGTFSTIPASMSIYVGGAGKQGSAAVGGYNGGGTAGGSHGDEGSGGGATDIRLTAALDDRIVVAGGGGGTGGWVGMAGAPGGGSIAQAGAGSSPYGGGGGSQLAGGAAGAGYAAGSGTAGAKGVGGAGGVGSVAGGGGGGGGYFGGGGGGADGIPSGTDGAGGGGGSSFASANYTKSITHSAGVRSGNGQAVLTYAYAPTVTAFAPTSSSSNQNSVQFNLSFSQNVTGLEATDFGFAGTAGGCSVSSLTGSGAAYAATVSGCSDGTLGLTLTPDSVNGATLGPVAQASSTLVTLDRKNPSFTVVAPLTPSNQVSLPFVVTADENVTGLSANSFSVLGIGCQVGAVTGSGQNYVVALTGCASATTATLTLKANSATDANSNSGPLAAVVSSAVLVDLDAPTPLTFAKSSSSRAGLIGFELAMSEPVTGLGASSFLIHGDGCILSKFSGAKDTYGIWLTDCAQGTAVSVTLKQASASDAAGNLGPVVPIDSVVVAVDDVAPNASISVVTKSPQPVFEVQFSEVVQGLSVDSFSHSGTSTGCRFTLTSVLAGLTYRVTTTGCTPGSVRLELPTEVVIDATGNLGPAVQVSSEVVAIERVASTGTTNIADLHKRGTLKPTAAHSTKRAAVVPSAKRPTLRRPVVETASAVKPAQITSSEQGEPVNKTLGFGALGAAIALSGAWVYRRIR